MTSIDRVVEQATARDVDEYSFPYGDALTYCGDIGAFATDFGDLIHGDDEYFRKLRNEMSKALFYFENMASSTRENQIQYDLTLNNFLAQVGYLLTKAAYDNGIRWKHLESEE